MAIKGSSSSAYPAMIKSVDRQRRGCEMSLGKPTVGDDGHHHDSGFDSMNSYPSNKSHEPTTKKDNYPKDLKLSSTSMASAPSNHSPVSQKFSSESRLETDDCCDSGLGSSSNFLSADVGSSSCSESVSDRYNPRDNYTNSYGMTQQTYTSASDVGYASCSDSGLLKSVSVPKPVVKHSPPKSDADSKHYKGSLHDYLTKDLGGVFDFRSWDPIKDIKEKLSPKLLEEARALIWSQDDDKEFEALSAARDSDERVVAFALYIASSHKQLNLMNADRQTVLHIAAETCSAPLCRLLITRGADGAIADVWGDTPLHIAARCGRADVIKALCTTLTKPEVYHPYFRVPYKSLPQDNVQSYNHDGRTPVHLAAQEPNSQKHQEALRALVKYARADIDYRRLGDGYAPAHIAIDNGDNDCLETCLKIGADSEVRNYKGETPQQLAYLCCGKDENSEMVQLCQKHGAGKYQLAYAETESLYSEEQMDVDAEDELEHRVTHRMEQMSFD